MTQELDDFVDDIYATGQRLVLYQLLPATEPAHHLVRIVQMQANILAVAVPLIEEGKYRDALARHVAEIHRLENEADDALHQILAGLHDGITVIPAFVRARRWGELYELLEDTTDRAEKIANTLQGIMEQRV